MSGIWLSLTAATLTATALAVPAFADDIAAAKFEHIDHSPFTLSPSPTGVDYQAMVDEIETDPRIHTASLTDVVTAASPRRHGRYPLCHDTNLDPGLNPTGFCWDSDDDTTADWVPQGVTGSGDADPSGTIDGRRLIAASWHYTGDDFARISIADFTKPSAEIGYHHLLLVRPTASGDFAATENVHADGLMWLGDTLLLATGTRLQVYSLDHIWRTRTDGADAGEIGLVGDDAYARWHGWAMPMIAEYRTVWNPDGSWKPCASVTGTAPCLNSIALAPDRKSFLTAEYYRPDAAGGRVIRWGLDPDTGMPTGGATEAFRSPIWHQQGIATDGSAFYVSGDCPGTPPPDDPNDHSCIHKALPDAEPHVLTKAPPLTQNLSYWPMTGELWGINERINTTVGKRVVFNVKP